ncbi:hypothetical protein EHS25_005423 [Saitozyma podzolica]|uniref:Uncharacterized protein n=1 Tax=Saitozyma podzolica TaxID=1890683 RepID=A0A427XY53_9TREE|nr:hypothetical protein EHS25_005423 [Saitozyma podzolica]
MLHELQTPSHLPCFSPLSRVRIVRVRSSAISHLPRHSRALFPHNSSTPFSLVPSPPQPFVHSIRGPSRSRDLNSHLLISRPVVANKTDLCSTTPTVAPQISFGQAVHFPPEPEPEQPEQLGQREQPERGSTSSASASTADPSISADPTSALSAFPATAATAPSDPSISSTNPATAPRTKSTNPGRKSDPTLRPRAVTTLDGALFAKQHGLLYVETSAKEGWGVVEAFEWTAREVLEKVGRRELESRKVSRGVSTRLQMRLQGSRALRVILFQIESRIWGEPGHRGPALRLGRDCGRRG